MYVPAAAQLRILFAICWLPFCRCTNTMLRMANVCGWSNRLERETEKRNEPEEMGILWWPLPFHRAAHKIQYIYILVWMHAQNRGLRRRGDGGGTENPERNYARQSSAEEMVGTFESTHVRGQSRHRASMPTHKFASNFCTISMLLRFVFCLSCCCCSHNLCNTLRHSLCVCVVFTSRYLQFPFAY